MTQPLTVPFRYYKNPFHLFHEFMLKTTELQKQKEHAEAIQLDKGTFSKLLHQDYIDLGPEEYRRKYNPGIRAINKKVGEILRNKNIDLMTHDGRALVEKKINYEYPNPDHNRFSDRTFGVFRGIWQFFSPSARLEEIRAGDSFIRSSLLLFHGFRPNNSTKKEHVDLLWIGRTTVWTAEARAEAGHDILYVNAQECSTRERKFFSFYVPGLHDPHLNGRIKQIRGVLAGTVLDDAYKGDYPATAAPCVARKLQGWSEWFKQNDRLVDSKFVSDLKASVKKNVGYDYYPFDELKKRSHARSFDGDFSNEDNRNDECGYNLISVLESLCDGSQKFIPSIMVGSASHN